MAWALIGRFLLANWKAVALVLLALSFVGGVKWHLHNDAKTEAALKAAVVEKAAVVAELTTLQNSLASAQAAADKAIAEKAEAEKAAAKKLAAARKEWEKVYGAKPENRAWADSRIPDGVARKLRE